MLLLTLGLFTIGISGCGESATPPEQQSPAEQQAPASTAASNSATETGKVPSTQETAPSGEQPAETPRAQDQEQAVTAKDLLHRRFVLKTSDGADFSTKEKVLDIEFNEGLRVSGAVCNRFNGQGELENGVLTVRQMASTKMFCTDSDLNALEKQVASMLEQGAAVSFDGTIFTLRQGGHELVYEIADWIH